MVIKEITDTGIVGKKIESCYPIMDMSYSAFYVGRNTGQNKNIILNTDILTKKKFNIREVTDMGN